MPYAFESSRWQFSEWAASSSQVISYLSASVDVPTRVADGDGAHDFAVVQRAHLARVARNARSNQSVRRKRHRLHLTVGTHVEWVCPESHTDRLAQLVPWPVHLRYQPSKSTRGSLFLQQLPPVHHSTVGSRASSCWFPSCGTARRQRLRQHRLWQPSVLDLRRFCSLSHIYLAHLTFSCLHTVISGRSSVLNT